MAVEGGARERSAAADVLQVDLCAVPQKQVDHPLVALVGGEHQRGDTAATLQVDLRAVPQQLLDHLHVAIDGGGNQRRTAVAVSVSYTHLTLPTKRIV